MKRLMIVGIVGLALLTGCVAQPAQNHDETFYKVMRVMPEFQTSTDAQLATVGHTTCKIFEAARNVPDTNAWDISTGNLADNGLSDARAILTVAASVSAYCPEYRKQIPAQYLQ